MTIPFHRELSLVSAYTGFDEGTGRCNGWKAGSNHGHTCCLRLWNDGGCRGRWHWEVEAASAVVVVGGVGLGNRSREGTEVILLTRLFCLLNSPSIFHIVRPEKKGKSSRLHCTKIFGTNTYRPIFFKFTVATVRDKYSSFLYKS